MNTIIISICDVLTWRGIARFIFSLSFFLNHTAFSLFAYVFDLWILLIFASYKYKYRAGLTCNLVPYSFYVNTYLF